MSHKVLLKIGGRAFSDEQGFRELASAIRSSDADFIILHGGGSEISRALKEADRPSVFVDGVRVTQKEDMDIVERVLSQTVNKRIADVLSQNHVPCRRLAGADEGLLTAEKIRRRGRDMGYVGEIVNVNPRPVWEAWENHQVPVVSPISATRDGVKLNVNADTAAAALACGARCADLVYFSDVPGVLDEKKQLVPCLKIDAAEFLIRTGIISGGMVAKLESIVNAVKGGVQRVHITQWQGPETLRTLFENREIEKTTISE